MTTTTHQISKNSYHVTLPTLKKYQQTIHNKTSTHNKRPKTNNKSQKKNITLQKKNSKQHIHREEKKNKSNKKRHPYRIYTKPQK